MKGYTVAIVQANRDADDSLLGVRLGRLCIEHNISVQQIADRLKVTRTTVYAWFTGAAIITRSQHIKRVRRLVSHLESH